MNHSQFCERFNVPGSSASGRSMSTPCNGPQDEGAADLALATGWSAVYHAGFRKGASSSLRGPGEGISDDRLKQVGPYIALVGVALSVLIAWLIAGVQSPGRYRVDDVWAQAAIVCIVLGLFSMALGMFVAFLPEFRRTGDFARHLVRAERRSLVASRGVFALAVWLGLLGSGCVFFVLCASYGFDIDDPRGARVLFFIMPIFAFFGISVLVPVVVAVSTAVGLAGSRRTGGARDLLLAPPTADCLGWASIKAHSLRGIWILVAASPYYATVLLSFSEEIRRVNDTPMLITAIILIPLALLLEYWQMRTAAAVGAWAGAAIMIPAAAALVAALIVAAAWFVRLLLFIICVVTAKEVFRENLFEFWFFPALFVPAIWCLCTAFGKSFRWACRRSMTLPWALRFGGWLLRKGQGLVGFAGEGVENLEEVLAGIDPHVAPSQAARHYKTGMAALWGLLFAAVIGFLIAGEMSRKIFQEMRHYWGADTPKVSTIANWVFYITAVLLNFISMGAVYLFALVNRQIARLRTDEAIR